MRYVVDTGPNSKPPLIGALNLRPAAHTAPEAWTLHTLQTFKN